ncbi:MAG: carbohydrate ABC transporter permease, partial [Spirochaetota bacterium]
MSRVLVKRVSFYFLASILAFFILIPFFWMISTSLKEYGALMTIPIQWIPEQISFQSYAQVFTIFPFARAIFNSAFVSVLSTTITLLSASMAAYVFSKISFKGRETLFLIVLAT